MPLAEGDWADAGKVVCSFDSWSRPVASAKL